MQEKSSDTFPISQQVTEGVKMLLRIQTVYRAIPAQSDIHQVHNSIPIFLPHKVKNR